MVTIKLGRKTATCEDRLDRGSDILAHYVPITLKEASIETIRSGDFVGPITDRASCISTSLYSLVSKSFIVSVLSLIHI